MKIATNKINNLQQYKMSKNRTFDNKQSPQKYDTVNFTSNVVTEISEKATKICKTVTDKNKIITFNNANTLFESIEEVLGESYFKDLLNKAGLSITDNDKFIYNARTFRKDFLDSGLSLVLSPLSIINSIFKKLNIEPPAGFLRWWDEKSTHDKAYNQVLDIIEEFTQNGQKNSVLAEDEFELDRIQKNFKNTVGSNISKVKKEYDSKDERAINRLVTSFVSASYSAGDFYNISMLQKDNKEEADKASKNRFKQEMTRAVISALLTYFSLGAFNRHTKSNIWLNAGVIAGAALISEIASRMFLKTPLIPLTPKQAEKISQKNKAKEEKKNSANDKSNIAFKASLAKEQEIFKSFTKEDGTFSAINTLKASNAKEANTINENTAEQTPAKKSNIGKIIVGLLAGCNILYLILNAKSFAKGKSDIIDKFIDKIEKFKTFEKKFAKKKIESNICNIYNNLNVLKETANRQQNDSDKIIKVFEEHVSNYTQENIINMNAVTNNQPKIFEGAKETIFKKITANKELLKKVCNKFLELISEGKTSDEAISEIKEMFLKEEFQQEELNTVLQEMYEKISKLKISDNEKGIAHSIYTGITKTFTTIYTFLSAPAAGLVNIIKAKNKANEALLNKAMNKEMLYETKADYEPLAHLGEILKGLNEVKNKSTEQIEENNNKILEKIVKSSRNIESGPETGNLANISRSMVTLISSYFFVNDYRNKVLIESGGKDIEGANEERNERLMHKASNFFFNGTLMNTFNSIFAKALNKSLIGAALVAMATELTNEFMVRKSICQPIGKQESKEAIIKYEEEQLNKKGFMGWWSRTFKKITGKKTLTQKAGIDTNQQTHNSALYAHQG